ncbi:unnamed protein product [Oppiella nova]|uniref:Uncharacterized protein n=1 Tax=Oppiella nova TaxID=334625 RepID=A0A7R9QCM1_9ACAR|nr:unnamed protein product [Oppiella nova]CAG2162576.1 unnamed protein product [Oppiella nova]
MSPLCESAKHGLEGHRCVIELPVRDGKPHNDRIDQVCHEGEDRPLLPTFSSTMAKTFTIMFLCLSMFSVGAGYSLLAPFFPTKAKSKNVSELWIGMDQSSVKTISVLSLLKNFGFTLCLSITINSALLIGFNEATLDLHLASIEKLAPSTKGAIFLVSGLTYTIVSQIFGYLGDKVKDCYPMCIFGCGSSVICFIVIGPLPFFSIKPYEY